MTAYDFLNFQEVSDLLKKAGLVMEIDKNEKKFAIGEAKHKGKLLKIANKYWAANDPNCPIWYFRNLEEVKGFAYGYAFAKGANANDF